MRFSTALPIIAAFALAACGSDSAGVDAENGADGEEMSAEELANEMADAEMPEPGEYESSIELLEFNLPGAEEGFADMMRAAFESSAAQSSTSCITPEQASTAREDMIAGMAQGDCSVVRMDMSGGRIDAAMECEVEGGVSSSVTMEGVMNASGADMVVSSSVPVPEMGEANIRMRVKTERIGDCA